MAVFVYGSLLFDEVLLALLKRNPSTRPAVLRGFTRYALRGRVYPAIAPASEAAGDGGQVEGLLLCDLTAAERSILDDFEDEDYVKTMLDVRAEDGAMVQADAYVWRAEFASELEGSWDCATFRAAHLDEYLVMCRRWVAAGFDWSKVE